MNIITKQIQTIERIDRLVRMQATGTPDQLASRLGISRDKLYRIIEIMRELHAPIHYDLAVQSYIYETAVGFRCGFFVNELEGDELVQLSGGTGWPIKKTAIFYGSLIK